ncbi:N-6 DNA methylase [Desulfobacula phenolica]|uniref:site-specific DNA-methyltransferase (adenine-specific) n=1 Tax=Desulfobacula phenolica TaxID=90732 RepID=A0A1H2EC83_9BACT|nr:N-6 DNA methylase [Desulfobacula phenolica]SDT92756.1 N-6 DNA Methylase [Desulfobacula phenolica]
MNITKTVKAFGCHDVVLFEGSPDPRHIDYLDLLKQPGQKHPKIDAVAEFQSSPLLYIISGERMHHIDDEKLLDLQCLLANRGERAFLGIINPGELVVYPINLDRSALIDKKNISIKKDSANAPLFFQSIVNGVFTLEGQPEAPDFVFKAILDLITNSSKELIEYYNINPLDVLSFLGRTLFFRFLWDRKIILPNELDSICPDTDSHAGCFENVKNSVATCQWLDQTFNGDLLPFSEDYISVFEKADHQTNGKIFLHLQAILKSWEYAGISAFQTIIDWGDLDFAHIPIGVLSQVYENFSKIWDSQQREQTSAYYTPKNIARYLVDDAFEGLSNKKDARILDPSCGAGIFLVLSFRKLVAARWEHDGKRPNTKTIQSILYRQICGFDVSESALRLSALSLYITAIELNGTPRPPKSLKFPKPLQDIVLHNHRRPEERDTKDFVLGSLRSDIPNEFDGSFDIIIGNPPWSRLKKDNPEFTILTRQILTSRGFEDLAKTYKNPDKNPDLPFLWKSVQWAKPGGIIAMALPGRIFLKQTKPGIKAFNAILKGIEITGILNGSNLSDSPVWPGMNQPFILLFARNQIPSVDHSFYFATPHFERYLNDKGRLRIDYQSAHPVSITKLIESPRLLKTLAIGTILDQGLIEKINSLDWPTVKSYWESQDLYTGLGFNLSPKLKQYDASFMRGLPIFSRPEDNSFSVDVPFAEKFTNPTAHMPRKMELYTPPVLIIPESAGKSLFTPKSWIVKTPVAFSKSYYGFSAFGSGQSDLEIAVLHLITHSELFRYYVLITSSRVAAERRTFLKESIDNFPYPEIKGLAKSTTNKILELSYELETSSNKPWETVNDFIFALYGLDKNDKQIIKDTLEVGQPFKKSRDRANARPNDKERNAFYCQLQRFLSPSFSITNEKISINEIQFKNQDIISSWHFFAISSSSMLTNPVKKIHESLLNKISEEANKTGCSRVIVHGDGYLTIGIISQYRYWTLSRARLCALEIQRHHLDTFPIGRA